MRLRRGRTIVGYRVAFLVAACFICGVQAPRKVSAAGYMDGEALGDRLSELARLHPDRVRGESVARSLGGRDVWLVELGAGTPEERRIRPAMLVVAGIEGNDLAGSAAAVTWIERLLDQHQENCEVRDLLDTTTIYLFPRLNPDAAERFFKRPVAETSVSSKPVDDDHDGMKDEDGPEDLNGDGRITWMRVEDREGEYVLDPEEPRLLMKADQTKGEVGTWRLLTEGVDNDSDEKWNEDGPGGVNFNRNFPFQYKWFAPWAGVHQVSEIETRALADFVVAHPNIGIVFTFGAADNLIGTPKSESKAVGRNKPATVINEKDLPYYREIGKVYRETLALKKELEAVSEPGSFSDWMYFHRGRFSLAARAWCPAMQMELEKAEKKEEKEQEAEEKTADEGGSDRKGDRDKRNEEDRAFLKWVDEHAPHLFAPWKKFDHPDFPGQRAEIGGFAPFARTAPPEAILDDITSKRASFLTTLALKLPRVGIRKIESKHLGESVYEVEIQVENTGYLPAALTHGEITREVYPTRVTLDLDDKAFLSGTKMTRLSAIKGSGGMKEIRYVLRVPERKRIRVSVVSMLGGTVEEVLELGGEEE